MSDFAKLVKTIDELVEVSRTNKRPLYIAPCLEEIHTLHASEKEGSMLKLTYGSDDDTFELMIDPEYCDFDFNDGVLEGVDSDDDPYGISFDIADLENMM